MSEQHHNDDLKDKKVVVQDSLRKLKEKLERGLKYSLLVSAVLNFSMLVIGCLNVHKCPVDKNIPLFLIATGAIGLISKSVSYVRNRVSTYINVAYIELTLYIVELIFLCLGAYWVYTEFEPSYDANNKEAYCNKTAYIFAFTYITIFFGITTAILCGFCCFICCVLCLVMLLNPRDLESQANDEATTS